MTATDRSLQLVMTSEQPVKNNETQGLRCFFVVYKNKIDTFS